MISSLGIDWSYRFRCLATWLYLIVDVIGCKFFSGVIKGAVSRLTYRVFIINLLCYLAKERKNAKWWTQKNFNQKEKMMSNRFKVPPKWQFWFLDIQPQNEIWWTLIQFNPCNPVLLVQNVLFRHVVRFYPIYLSVWWHMAIKWQLGKRTCDNQPRHPPFKLVTFSPGNWTILFMGF